MKVGKDSKEEEETVCIPKLFLMRASNRLAILFEREKDEGSLSKVLALPATIPSSFKEILRWLYDGEILWHCEENGNFYNHTLAIELCIVATLWNVPKLYELAIKKLEKTSESCTMTSSTFEYANLIFARIRKPGSLHHYVAMLIVMESINMVCEDEEMG